MPINRTSTGAGTFAILLSRLGSGDEYEGLRRRLVAFFTWDQCEDPETLADEALDRLARKLSEGAAIGNLKSYAAGIARLLAKEHRALRQRECAVIREFSSSLPDTAELRRREVASADLEACLGALDREQRDLLLRYYGGAPNTRIEDRKVMAEELRLEPNALRNRLLRLRKSLLDCIVKRAALRDACANSPTQSMGARR
jgi:DNA-directed RNA polymerase specialized sigma24 family protein